MIRKSNTICDFFKRKDAQSSNDQRSNAWSLNVQSSNAQNLNAQNSNAQSSNVNVDDKSSTTSNIQIFENPSKRLQGVDGNEFDISTLKFDLGLCH
jgi:hypothetical protein